MKKLRVTLLLGLLLSQIPLFGQHSWYPGTYSYSALDASGAVKEYLIFINESGSPVQLELALVENTLDPAWSIAFCYPETCRNFDIAYDTTTVIAAADSGNFSMEVIPFGVAGHGLISYEIWERGNPQGWHDTLTWEFDVTVGIDDIEVEHQLNIWPQPANGSIHLDCRADILGARLFDLQGKVVFTRSFNPAEEQVVMLPGLSPAVYVLELETREGTIYRRVSLR